MSKCTNKYDPDWPMGINQLERYERLQFQLVAEKGKSHYLRQCLGDLLSLTSGETWRIIDQILQSKWKGQCSESNPILIPKGEKIIAVEKECDDLRAENTRLRGVLEKIRRNIRGGVVSTGWIESYIEEQLKEKP